MSAGTRLGDAGRTPTFWDGERLSTAAQSDLRFFMRKLNCRDFYVKSLNL